jgi:AAA domain/DnaB-like helicase N terminal domain
VIENPDTTEQVERALLGCLLENSTLICQIDFDLANDLWSSNHRALWRAMAELHGEGIEPSDRVLLAERAKVDVALVADLLTSGAIAANFPRYLHRTRELARARRIRNLAEELRTANPGDFPGIIERLHEQQTQLSGKSARHFRDIPEIQILDIPPTDYIVPALGIARNTITLWTGEDGSGKTILASAMSGSVAQGQNFLGMSCQQCPVLYLDLENPAYVVQGRIRAMFGEQTIPQLRVWGTWDQVQPPQSGNTQLLRICEETRPLVIIDPFRYFHDGEEDSSTAMAPVMKYLRACAVCGGAVVVLHHPAKTENSKGRGSSAIRAGCDLAFLHKLDKEANSITLRVDKNRHGERRDFTIKADFEEGHFELSEAAWLQHRYDQIECLQELIRKAPGISSNQLAARAGGRKGRVLKVLEEGAGTLWVRQPGPRGSKIFFPTEGTGSWFPSKEGEPGNQPRNALTVPGTSGNQWEPGTGEATQMRS